MSQSVLSIWAVRLSAVALVFASAGSVMAQRPGGGGFGGGPGGGGPGGQGGGDVTMRLLNAEQVQKELELVDDQKEQLKKVAEESRTGMRDLFGGLRDLPEAEREKKFAELRTKMEERRAELAKKVDSVLLDHQKKRLKEISLQVQGNRALADKDVIAALKLTDEQQADLKKLSESQQTAMREAFSGGREGAREKLETLRKESEEKTMAILTSEQKAKLEEMKGKKFELDRAAVGGRRGGPGGEGGERQRRQRGEKKAPDA